MSGPIYGSWWEILLTLIDTNYDDLLASHWACCDIDDPPSSWLYIVIEKNAGKQLSRGWIQVHFILYYWYLALFMVAGGESFYLLLDLIPVTFSLSLLWHRWPNTLWVMYSDGEKSQEDTLSGVDPVPLQIILLMSCLIYGCWWEIFLCLVETNSGNLFASH